jgi:dihydromonapterin reductase/dihydrofolate reductase
MAPSINSLPVASMSYKPSILITGGAQRVGLHCAQRFVEDGFRVLITCRQARPEWQQQPLEGIEVLFADFSTVDGIQQLINQLVNQGVRLRGLIHNASVWQDDEQQANALQTMFMVHMQAPYLLNLAHDQLFDPDSIGDIIHISDHVAQRGSARHVAYSASKAGLEAISRSFAAQLAPRIKVNSIAPALIMFNDGAGHRARTRGGLPVHSLSDGQSLRYRYLPGSEWRQEPQMNRHENSDES